jgi:hypothetical protein
MVLAKNVFFLVLLFTELTLDKAQVRIIKAIHHGAWNAHLMPSL